MNDQVQFTPVQMSILALISEVIHSFMVLSYHTHLKYLSLRRTYLFTGIISIFIGVMPICLTLSIPAEECSGGKYNTTFNFDLNTTTCYFYQYYNIDPMLLALTDDILGEVIDTVRNMPLTMVLMIICGARMEASNYSTILGILNSVGLIKRLADSRVITWWEITETNYTRLSGFIIFCVCLESLTVIFIPLIPDVNIAQIEQDTKNEQEIKSINDLIQECIHTTNGIVLEETEKNTRRRLPYTANSPTKGYFNIQELHTAVI
jgi:hypothetical protein